MWDYVFKGLIAIALVNKISHTLTTDGTKYRAKQIVVSIILLISILVSVPVPEVKMAHPVHIKLLFSSNMENIVSTSSAVVHP